MKPDYLNCASGVRDEPNQNKELKIARLGAHHAKLSQSKSSNDIMIKIISMTMISTLTMALTKHNY